MFTERSRAEGIVVPRVQKSEDSSKSLGFIDKGLSQQMWYTEVEKPVT